MSKSTDELNDAIAAHRAELRARAELADGDLDEIEVHLRSLTEDLRGRGVPAAEAVTEAARRLGESRVVAREHGRVRSAFGARLSTARTWSVVALLVPVLAYSAVTMYAYTGLWHRYMLECALGIGLAAALVLRLGWARPILLGGVAFFTLPTAVMTYSFAEMPPFYLVWHLGLVALLVPRRRDELTSSGLALASYIWAYGAASWALSFQMTGPGGELLYILSPAFVASIAAGVATVGAVLRARWSSLAGIAAAGALATTIYDVLGIDFRFEHPALMEVAIFGSLATGAIAAGIGAVLAWRTARSPLGSLRALRS